MQAVEPLMSSSVQLPFIASSSHQPPFCALVPSSSCHCQLCTCLSGVGAVAQARMDVYSSAPFFNAFRHCLAYHVIINSMILFIMGSLAEARRKSSCRQTNPKWRTNNMKFCRSISSMNT
eukprot:scaffold30222_cov17-Tisochrysis_lutea.AAC.1